MDDSVYCEKRTDDPDIEQKWFAKHSFEKASDGSFEVDSYKGKLPVEHEKLFENIKENLSSKDRRELPQVVYDPRTFVMCCGGPSIEKHLDEIRAKSKDPNFFVVCSNMTAEYLLDNDIIPAVHFVIDPKKSKALDVKRTHPQIQYWINCACDPEVVKVLEEQGIEPEFFLAQCDSEGKDIETVKQSLRAGLPHNMMAIQGGTMAGMRAINLADGRGFRKMEFYGLDASIQSNGEAYRCYAYKKVRGETIIEIECDKCGSKYDSTLVLQKQVNEFLDWRRRMPWIQMKLYGDGLLQHYVSHLEREEAEIEAFRPKYRFTKEYAEMQKQMHEHYTKYGAGVPALLQTIFSMTSQLVKRHGSLTVLDYGSADGNVEKGLTEKFWVPPGVSFVNYDPFIEGSSKDPEPANLVLCMDVMEHVEPQCTEAVLDHIQALTKNVVLFSICMVPAKKVLPDGRNAHINLRDAEYWMCQVRKRFIVSEFKATHDALLFVGQSIEAVRKSLS